ncbi:MAG: 4Fe-4S binding protein [Coriobacteriia bacterium]
MSSNLDDERILKEQASAMTWTEMFGQDFEIQPPSLNEERYLSAFPKREIKANHRFLKWEFTAANGNIVGAALEGFRAFLALARFPWIARHHPLTKEGNYHVSIPMNVVLESEEIELPLAIIDELIDTSADHVILDRCVCRSGRHCEHHDPTIGCLFLGDSGLDVIPHYSRRVSAEEAKAHVRLGLANGLVPMTCRTKIDNIAFQLKDRHTLLGICLCCDCCCYMAHFRAAPTEQLDKIYPMLGGMHVSVDPSKCSGCGTCTKTCFMGCISVENGVAVHGDKCRGCGRCEVACPNNAVTLTLSDPAYKDLTVQKFLSIADLSAKRHP